MRLLKLLGGFGLLAAATPALADPTDPPPAVTVSGNVSFVSDYRLRGVSQSDTKPAIQGGITVAHKTGFYLSVWGSNLAGWGTFGGPNLELDGTFGFKHALFKGTADVGVTWYNYPGGATLTDYVEFYAKLTGTKGPVTVTGGVLYAPPQRALANYSNTPFSRQQLEDNLYLITDVAAGIPKTPFTLKGHVGYSAGNPGLDPNGTSVAPTGSYADWSLGSDVTWRNLTFNVSYVDTDITETEAARLRPQFSRGQNNSGSISNATVVVSLTAAF